METDKHKRIFVFFVLFLFCVPVLCHMGSFVFNLPFDVSLNGYTDNIDMPMLSMQSIQEGSFQKKYSDWFQNNMKPNGVFIRTYSTLRYSLFGLGNMVVGKDGDLFSDAYIDSELCIRNGIDYSNTNEYDNMKQFVTKLITVRDKLRMKGKAFFVYITPSKAYYDFDHIPEEMKALSSKNSINAVTCFSELIKSTDLAYLICRDMELDNEWPPFYPTGIHWSRPYEQVTSSLIVDRLSELTGKNYQRLILDNLEKRNIPYWRDSDQYDLLNLWYDRHDIMYYQYNFVNNSNEEHVPLRFIVQGDSFAEGLIADTKAICPDVECYFINRNLHLYNYQTSEYDKIEKWNTFDLKKYLDVVDVVIIEHTEGNLSGLSSGFVDYLIDYLETYKSN